MDWFERLTGFQETTYEATRARLEVSGNRLCSRVNGASYGIGTLELVSLSELRARAMEQPVPSGQLRLGVVSGDVGQMHRDVANAGAIFQVASQFNLLEMTSDSITPEDGVARYQWDHTTESGLCHRGGHGDDLPQPLCRGERPNGTDRHVPAGRPSRSRNRIEQGSRHAGRGTLVNAEWLRDVQPGWSRCHIATPQRLAGRAG